MTQPRNLRKQFVAEWTDADGARHRVRFGSKAAALAEENNQRAQALRERAARLERATAAVLSRMSGSEAAA